MKVPLLSAKSTGAKHSQSRTDSLIGEGVRVEGNIRFTGVLRVQGDLLGDVSCDADADGTIVVGESGNVTGAISAPHAVVSGRVHGPMHSWASIEVQHHAHVAGDVSYKELDIHAGGVIEGSLTPGFVMESGPARPEHPAQNQESSPRTGCDILPANEVSAGSGFMERFGGAKGIGGGLALLVVVAVAALLLSRDPAPVVPPVVQASADVAVKVDPSAKEAPTDQSTVAGRGGLQDGLKAAAGVAALPVLAPVPAPAADLGSGVRASPPELPDADPGKVALVQGVNPGKPAGVLLVISKEPAVLFRKKRPDTSEGSRIDISRGATESIPFAKDEVFRVASGRDLQMFYQGRKVTPRTLESGVWMSFVPVAGDRK